LLVIDQDALGQPASRAYCEEIRDEYGLGDAVVLDPTGGVTAYGANELMLVSDERGKLVFVRRGAELSALRAAIEAELAD